MSISLKKIVLESVRFPLVEKILPPGFKASDFHRVYIDGSDDIAESECDDCGCVINEKISDFKDANLSKLPGEYVKGLLNRKVAFDTVDRFEYLIGDYKSLIGVSDEKERSAIIKKVISQSKRLGIEQKMKDAIKNSENPEYVSSVIVDLKSQKKQAKDYFEKTYKQKHGYKKTDDSTQLAARPEKMIHTSTVRKDGNLKDSISLEKFKKIITTVPDKFIGRNKKIQKSGGNRYMFYNITLPAYQGLIVDEDTGDFYSVRTCPMAGICKNYCYAAKGGYVICPTVVLRSAQMVNFLINHPDEFKEKMISSIQAAEKDTPKGLQTIIRWHDSGDFFSEKYLEIAFDVARSTPNVTHYAYTKMVTQTLKNEAPDNFTFNLSVGGEEDSKINMVVNKNAQVVNADVFKSIMKKKDGKFVLRDKTDPTTGNVIGKYKLIDLKEAIGQHYNLDPSTIITYTELLSLPYDPMDKSQYKKYNVLVWSGHGDDAAFRKDVLGTYLFIH